MTALLGELAHFVAEDPLQMEFLLRNACSGWPASARILPLMAGEGPCR